MEPRIIFLGSGTDPAVLGKQIRASGGIVIQTEDYQFHIDPGPGALVRASEYAINPRETTCLLISHAHTNHCTDTNALIAAMSLNGLDTQGVVIASKSVVEGDEQAKINQVITDFHKACVERVIAPEAQKRIGINDLEIYTLKTKHNDPTAIGFKLISPNYVITYSADTGYTKEIAAQYEKSDILILNVPLPAGQSSRTNLSSDDVIKIITEVKPKLCIMTHFGKKMLDADPLQEARNIQRTTGIQTVAASDGLYIDPLTNSFSVRQKTIQQYQE